MKFYEEAEKVQKANIKSWLTVTYVGGHKAVGKWSDHYFSIAGFPAGALAHSAGISTTSARRHLDAMALCGIIDRMKTYGPVSYRLTRNVCDRLAEEATADLLASGLKMDRVG